jgi:DNA invertase Pin-like site-specific DNA recombinase
MLAEVSVLRPSVLLLWKADRLARDRHEVAAARKAMADAGCRVCYVAGNTPDSDSPGASPMESMLDGMADYYSKQLARNIRRGVNYNAQHALSIGHKMLGYATDETKHYVIDEDTAPIVRRVFSEYAAGKPLQQIADDLNAQGLSTSRGGKFNVHGLRKTLKNDKYLGIYRCGDIVIEGGMPQLVSQETFDKVQARFAANKRKGPQLAHGLDDEGAPRYWLTGKLFCGECGHSMQGTYGTSKTGATYRYYGRGEHLKRHGCKKKHVRKEKVEEAVVQILHAFLNDQELLASFAADAAAYYEQTYGDDSYRRGLQNELRETDKALKKYPKLV